MSESQPPDIENMNYPARFRRCGVSSFDLIEAAMKMIEPEVLDFQGQIMSPEL